MKKLILVACFLIPFLSTSALGADKPDEINPEIQRALEVSDIRYSKMPQFRLSATVTVTLENKDPLQGKYLIPEEFGWKLERRVDSTRLPSATGR